MIGALKGLEDVGGGSLPGLRGTPPPTGPAPCGFCDSPGLRERLLRVVNLFSGALLGTGWGTGWLLLPILPWEPREAPPLPYTTPSYLSGSL